MKPYRVTKVEPMSQPTFSVNHKMLYEIVFRATPDDVTLEFGSTNAIKGLQETCLNAFEHLPSDGSGDAEFDREFAATSFGASVETLGPRDKGLLHKALRKLSPAGKKALVNPVS